MTVLLLTDAAMDTHQAAGHPERPERRDAAAAGVRDAAGDLLVEDDPPPATDDEVLAVHDAAYLRLLRDADGRGGGWLDADTYLVPGSMRAAELAAGATIQAARAADSGAAEVAFAVVRPPGHHATRDRGSGFCLLNSVAIAAAALRAGGVQRVAIVDWDVHHGDGTQSIFDADPDLWYGSTHQAPFYPGPEPRGSAVVARRWEPSSIDRWRRGRGMTPSSRHGGMTCSPRSRASRRARFSCPPASTRIVTIRSRGSM